METGNHSKNGASLKSQTSRGKTGIFILGLLLILLAGFSACGGGSGSGSSSSSSSSGGSGSAKSSSALPTSKVDYQMLSNDAELKKVYDAILEKLGENVKNVDEISIYISRPSSEGVIIRQGKPDEFAISLSYLYPQDKNKLYRQNYNNEYKWMQGEVKGVRLITGNAETFRLQDEMFDLSPLTAETLSKIVKDAFEKYKDAGKYSYQYVKRIDIKDSIVKVQIYGKLTVNDMEKSNYYYANLSGVVKK